MRTCISTNYNFDIGNYTNNVDSHYNFHHLDFNNNNIGNNYSNNPNDNDHLSNHNHKQPKYGGCEFHSNHNQPVGNNVKFT